MADDEHPHPTTNQPLHGEPRSAVKPIFGVIALLAAVALVFIVITWVRYST